MLYHPTLNSFPFLYCCIISYKLLFVEVFCLFVCLSVCLFGHVLLVCVDIINSLNVTCVLSYMVMDQIIIKVC